MTGGYANNPGVCGALLRSCPVIMQKKCRGGGLAAVATGAVILTTIVVPIVLYYLLPRVTRKEEDDPEGNKWAKSIKTKGIKVLVFEKWLLKMRFGDLMKTTNNFHTNNIIGDSRTGTTYRAMLPDAQFLMVKRLQDSQHLEKEFASEMNALRSLKHCNLFSSITFLRGGKGKVLVYEYMEHGTLYGQFQTLESEAASRTDWPSRLRIAIEAAKGLAWLHHNRNPRIIPSIRTSAPNACS